MHRKLPLTCGFVAVIFAAYSMNAFAYLDPGTASILLQGLIAAVAGAVITLKLYWYRIKSIFSKPSNEIEERLDLSESNDQSERPGTDR